MSKPFDPADPGTPEGDWNAFLQTTPLWAPPAGTLLVVAPHPDDEVLGAGGLISSWTAAGHQVRILSVTDGEAADRERRDLDLVRRRELQRALRSLSSVSIEVTRVGLPDGDVEHHLNLLRNVMMEFAVPGTTIVGPYEKDRHPDHEAVGQLCADVARTTGVSLARYPIWTWHHTSPEEVRTLRWVRFAFDSAAMRAKAHAVQCFESQLNPPSGRPVVPAHVLTYFQRSYEAFVV